MADYQVEDCKALISELKEEDKRLRLKRRFLMDLHLSKTDHKHIKKLLPLSDKSIPEAILREDDEYYDNIKNFVERVSGASTSIKKRDLCSSYESDCFRGSANTVLNLLDELPIPILEAMHRRLKGKSRSSILDHRKARKKRELVPAVKRLCMKMLDKKHPPESFMEALSMAGVTLKLILGHRYIKDFKIFSPEVESLQNSIANAILIIDTDKKIEKSVLEKACKNLHFMLGCEVEVSKRSLRFVVRNLLIEYLAECSEMENIPKNLVEILNGVNNTCSKSTSKTDGEDDVEFLLCFSAQIKQIIWDVLPDEDLDQDFATAYMEESEDCEDEDYTNDYLTSQNLDFDSIEMVSESVGEINPDESSVFTQEVVDDSVPVKQEPLDFSSFSFRNQSISVLDNDEVKPDESEFKTNQIGWKFDKKHIKGESGDDIDQKHCTNKNKYLKIQRACDETAMAMHGVIDGILMELRKT